MTVGTIFSCIHYDLRWILSVEIVQWVTLQCLVLHGFRQITFLQRPSLDEYRPEILTILSFCVYRKSAIITLGFILRN